MTDQTHVFLHGKQENALTGGTWRPVIVTNSGELGVALTSGGSSITVSIADAQTPAANSNVPIVSYNMLFNGATFDRQRGNVNATLLASAARTATTATADQTNYNGRGVHIIIDVTAIGAVTVTPTIQGKDPASGKYYSLLAATAISATGTVVLKVGPGIQPFVSQSAADMLPRTWRVNFVHSNANSVTYSAGAIVIV